MIRLEERLSLAEAHLEALDRTVFRQQQQIDRLQAQLRLVWQQLQTAQTAQTAQTLESRDLRDEIPPHY